MSTLRRLDLYWRHGDCTEATHMSVRNAVVRATLMYGPEPLELTEATQAQLGAIAVEGPETQIEDGNDVR